MTATELIPVIPLEQRVAAGVAAFEQKKALLIDLAEASKGLKVTDIQDNKELAIVTTARKNLKKERCAIENEAKDLRKDVAEVTKHITTKEKELTGIISPIEDELQAEEDRVASERKAIQDEADRLEAERINNRVKQLLGNGCTYDGTRYSIADLNISHIQVTLLEDSPFAAFILSVAAENKKIQEAEAERLRIEAEAKEAERLRVIAEQEQLRKDREELAALRAQQEEIRLKNEAEAKRLQEEKEAAERAQAEAKRKEAEALINARVHELKGLGLTDHGGHFAHPLYKNTGVDKSTIEVANSSDWEELIALFNQRIEEGKKEAETKRIADLEAAKEQARKDEAARIEKENAENLRLANEKKAEEERQAALAPDKEKLIAFNNILKGLVVPACTTEAAQKIASEVYVLLNKVQNHIVTKTKSL